ncbi:DUF4148 domain-containing protein [Ramlibacter sp. USB13]|uniref:DUF4148 domain-containing protein n=1 Tax=Ramlibacter cellulosilyticus TaxID=2764187 RepID=A0A923MV71_9BURK|nr:DUF4148 domain-containing protein [Ramlibacter cellulosilyticus]MBC5785249.1 DUF4148 domain-containing protein [Ramlibacter cellulosilyticus]
MNRYLATVAAALLAAAGTAFADDITMDPHPFQSTATRAQVMEEFHQFRRSGVNPWADDYDQIAHGSGAMTRAEATAAFLAERSTVAALSGEDSGSSYLARVAAAHSRVQATELAAAE